MEKNYDFLFKITIIGNSDVGKSCILSKYVDNSFRDDTTGTIGVDFKVKNIKFKRKSIKLQIWDPSGTERYRNIISSYFRGCHGIILVYDVTNKDSFQNISEWNDMIERNTQGKIFKVLVGNKSDMDYYRVITDEEGKN